MPLHLHRAPRTDLLADALGALLSTPQADPFAEEVVVVPAQGVERWLSQRLSHVLGAGAVGDGVCAGVSLRRPGSLLAEVLGTRDDDPWSAPALVWPLLAVLDEVVEGVVEGGVTGPEAWARTVAVHLGADRPAGEERDLRRGRRLAVAGRLARLFAGYGVQRPAVLAAWHAGSDTDGRGRPVPGDLAWQPELWRRLAARVAAPPPHERHRAAVERLRAEPGSCDLPARVSLFGHTRLAASEVALLEALGHHRAVHLWLPHPSAALWDALAPEAAAGPVPRAEDLSHRSVGHPLLATLGRDTRELQRTLATATVLDEPVTGAVEEPATLLGHLQHDLRAAAAPTPPVRRERVLSPDDRSVQVHACHGLARQVDVLREVLLGLLDDDPTLEPRDVLVMCPDIETAAPLVEAGFGLADVAGRDAHPAHRLRVSLADRSPSSTNPLLAVLRRVVDLAGGRARADDVLDLAHAGPVRRRFGLRDNDLAQLGEWVRASGVRWAFDAEHRADYGLADVVGGTWQFGLDRLLTGVALSDDSGTWLGTTLPLDDVGSGQVDLVGRLAEYVARLRATTDALVGAHPLEHWLDVLLTGLDELTATASDEAWQRGQVQRELGRVRAEATDLLDTPLRLPDLRALLDDRLGARPSRASFRTGTLTVATLVPMRSVPHRVVCLLGLDDGVYPRVGVVDGDDLLARDPVTGERDARSEDRQLLLDAVLAATETLVVTWSGADEYSGQPRPPAVPLGELLDALDLTATVGEGSAAGSVAEAVTVRHPLQPFDARNHEPGALVPDRAFSYDRATLAGARAALGPRTEPSAFLDGVLPPVADDPAGSGAVVGLDELLTWWKDPVRGFLRQRLDVGLPLDEPAVESGLPVEVDPLVLWSVGDRVLGDLLAGTDPATAAQREWRRGVLPPGRLGWRTLTGLVDGARPIAAEGLRLRTREPHAVDVDLDLGDGRRLVGTVPAVHGDRLVTLTWSRLAGTHRLQAWLQLLALAAADPDRSWTAHTLGRPAGSRSREPFATSLLGPLDHTALEVLRRLVRVRDTGLCEPLPLPLKASLTYARQRRTRAGSDEAMVRAIRDWEDGRFPGEGARPAHVKVFGVAAPLPGSRPGSVPAGEEHPGEVTRFGALAMQVWSPLLDAEQGSW